MNKVTKHGQVEDKKVEDTPSKKVKLEFKEKEIKDDNNIFVNQLDHKEEEQEKKCMEIMLHSYKYNFKGETYESAMPYWGEKDIMLS